MGADTLVPREHLFAVASFAVREVKIRFCVGFFLLVFVLDQIPTSANTNSLSSASFCGDSSFFG